MAIDYTLYLKRTTLPVIAPHDLVWVSERIVDDRVATIIEEEYDFRPTRYVRFRPDKERWGEAHVTLAAMVGELLGQADDDVLLLMNGELPVLRRSGGRTVVSTRSEWTTPERLSAFGISVERGDLGDVP